jgi:hypothetical protein
MTDRQKLTLENVLRQTLANKWYRAAGNGERVTLASLFRAGALVRVSPEMLEALKGSPA